MQVRTYKISIFRLSYVSNKRRMCPKNVTIIRAELQSFNAETISSLHSKKNQKDCKTPAVTINIFQKERIKHRRAELQSFSAETIFSSNNKKIKKILKPRL